MAGPSLATGQLTGRFSCLDPLGPRLHIHGVRARIHAAPHNPQVGETADADKTEKAAPSHTRFTLVSSPSTYEHLQLASASRDRNAYARHRAHGNLCSHLVICPRLSAAHHSPSGPEVRAPLSPSGGRKRHPFFALSSSHHMRRAVSKFMPAKFGKLSPDAPHGTYRLDHSSVDEYYISLEDPHRMWLPGDEITGQVILRSRKNLANISISFNLAGYVKIHALPHSKLRPMKTVLFSHTIQIYGPGAGSPQDLGFSSGLYKGEHRFPFVVKLPNRRVFTSIDFGKGAIVYVLLTRLSDAASDVGHASLSAAASPSSALAPLRDQELLSLRRAKEALAKLQHPTFSYEKIINLVNPVDVAHLPAPKRKRLVIKNTSKGKLLRVQLSSSTINTFVTLSSANSDAESVPADTTAANTQQLHATHTSLPQNPPSPANLAAVSQHRLPAPDMIRVYMDVAQRGYLRGELIPIKLSINHLRKIQDSTGIIVTLVRVCRIDYGPDSSYESFRKDLQQLVIPLFVDPVTFLLEISTSVRVPPDAFPTISGCPLVSFQYFIEVMLNLSGKSISLTTPAEQPKSNMVAQEDASGGLSPGHLSSYSYLSLTHSRSEYINTDKFKRLKKFLQMTTEVVIGTHRLVKRSGQENQLCARSLDLVSAALGSSVSLTQSPLGVSMTPAISTVPEGTPMENFDSPPYLYESTQTREDAASSNSRNVPTYADAAAALPRPELPVLSEKEQMRRHEASLLPSAPPVDDSDASDSESGNGHTEAPDNYHVYGAVNTASENTAFHLAADSQGTLGGAGHSEVGDGDLYEAPDIHEGIGLEGVAEYVPNYNSAANDLLVDPNRGSGESCDQQ